jgi:hypothetical protein
MAKLVTFVDMNNLAAHGRHYEYPSHNTLSIRAGGISSSKKSRCGERSSKSYRRGSQGELYCGAGRKLLHI